MEAFSVIVKSREPSFEALAATEAAAGHQYRRQLSPAAHGDFLRGPRLVGACTSSAY